jgi:hypothetical protein
MFAGGVDASGVESALRKSFAEKPRGTEERLGTEDPGARPRAITPLA